MIANFYTVHHAELVNFATSRLGNREESEDLVQDVFIKMMSFEGIINEATIKSFAFTIAANKVKDHLRRRIFRHQLEESKKYEMELQHSHADKIKISLSKKENSMELLLADNGVGIEKEDLKHIFERLYKCDKGRSEKGSGLGLSIVHQLVEKMGGSIAVESIPGKGTEFSLRFPLEI